MSSFRPVLFALAVLAGCQKVKEEIPVIPEPETEEATIVFVSERPQTETGDETRTHWNGETILWDQADNIRMGYTVAGKWQNASGNASANDAKLYKSNMATLTEDGAVASFSINAGFSGTTEGEHVFYAVYPGDATGTTMTDGAPIAEVELPATQTPLADSFDRLADLMLGHSIDEFTSRPTTPVMLVWNRVVAHGQITLKGLPGTVSGEKVSMITLTAQEGANLVGKQKMNIVTGEYSATNDNTAANKIVIKGDNLTIENGNVTFWMSILPVTLTSLTVEVATNKATYTREISGFTREFIANRRNILPIKMDRAVKTTSEGPAYRLVASNDDLGEGHYVLAYTMSGTSANLLSGKASNNNYGVYASGVAVTNGAIEYAAGNPYDIVIEATEAGYSLKLGDSYLGFTGSSNSLFFNSSYSASRDDWTLSVDSSGNATITSVYNTGRTIRWNDSSPRFACYTGGQQPVQLYKLASIGPSLVTKPATNISLSSATLNAMFANLGTNVTEAHFLWGTSADNLSNTLYTKDFNVTSGEFHATLASLEENTTYYFQAVIQYCEDGQNYLELTGDVLSFKTLSSSSGGNVGLQWLGCYEVPAIHLVNTTSASGSGEETNTSDNTAYWYNYYTTDSKQRAVTHSYVYQGKTYRNYTVLYDGNRHCPLWVAQVMHAEAYPNNKVGRNESWDYDPGIPSSWQQSGLKNAGTVGFSKGHFCASSDRQTCVDANRETFYYTNQAPQWQNGFNGGVWNSLEQDIPAPTERDTLYVVTGVLFEGEIQTLPSNDNKDVSIPSHVYKLLMRCSFNTSGEMIDAKGIAYLFTNESHTGEKYSSFATTIDAVEGRTGIDFFANVPVEFQGQAEQTDKQLW
ncbi:MAG: DNA/RNA non-specific endonuclease [Bacteroidales bacterium]|nr:DNA/RNA non-specific endonuclease [Bacteroidales bacterium]